MLATAVLVEGISNIPGIEENEKPNQVASGHRVQIESGYATRKMESSSISNRSAIQLLGVLQIS